MYRDSLKACVMLLLGGWIQSSQAVSDGLGRSLERWWHMCAQCAFFNRFCNAL